MIPVEVLAQADGIMLELRLLKKEKGIDPKTKERDQRKELDFAFLFVVDVVQQKSHLIICGARELALAKEAFPDCPLSAANANVDAPLGSTLDEEETCMEMPDGWVSRKAEFAPAFLSAMNGFECHKKPNAFLDEDDIMTMGEIMNFDEGLFLEAQESGYTHDSVKVVRTKTVKDIAFTIGESLSLGGSSFAAHGGKRRGFLVSSTSRSNLGVAVGVDLSFLSQGLMVVDDSRFVYL